MATESVAKPFTRFYRSFDGPELELVVEDPAGGNPLEWRSLDIRALPHRPDLLELGAVARERLLADAERCAVAESSELLPEEVDGPDGDIDLAEPARAGYATGSTSHG